MKTIGLLGGMSWESSLSYYKIINQHTNKLLGYHNNAKSILFTVNFEEIEKLQHQNRWNEAAQILIDGCLALENGGADFIVICTNTMHKLLPQLEQHIIIPFLHIAKATASKIKRKNIKNIILLCTNFTMSEDFNKKILIEEVINVEIPNNHDMDIIHKIIYDELCLGTISKQSKQIYLDIINKQQEIEGVILGCTEIGLLISQEDLDIKVFDTTYIHAIGAVECALDNKTLERNI
jgi:aspartate racemase